MPNIGEIYATARLDTGGFVNPLRGLRDALVQISSAFVPLAGAVAGLGAVGAAALGMKAAITKAADLEQMQVGFSVLLGSLDAAKSRMSELAKFAADTPFELPEVAQASRTLETLTHGALATGKGLTLVGDVASGTQQPFADLAVVIGRLYDGLQSGRQVGEAMMRLQELGVIGGETRGKIEALQQSGQRGEAVWQVAANAMGRFSGMMKQQSGTWNGLMSTLQDNIGAVFREFGTPLIDALKPALKKLIDMSDQLSGKAREWGGAMADAIYGAMEAFKGGQLGDLAALSLQAGIENGAPAIGNALIAAFRGPIAWLQASLESILDSFNGTGGKMSAVDRYQVKMKELGIAGAEKLKPEGDSPIAKAMRNDLESYQNMQRKQIEAIKVKYKGQTAEPFQEKFDRYFKDPQFGFSFGKGGGAGSEAFKKMWAEILKRREQLFPEGLSNTPFNPGAEPEISAAVGKGSKYAEGDRLAKIGAFIGAGGGPANDHARKTADNTQKLTQQIASLIEKGIKVIGAADSNAVYAA